MNQSRGFWSEKHGIEFYSAISSCNLSKRLYLLEPQFSHEDNNSTLCLRIIKNNLYEKFSTGPDSFIAPTRTSEGHQRGGVIFLSRLKPRAAFSRVLFPQLHWKHPHHLPGPLIWAPNAGIAYVLLKEERHLLKCAFLRCS